MQVQRSKELPPAATFLQGQLLDKVLRIDTGMDTVLFNLRYTLEHPSDGWTDSSGKVSLHEWTQQETVYRGRLQYAIQCKLKNLEIVHEA